MAAKGNKGRDAGLQLVCRNARATFDFTIEDKLVSRTEQASR